MDKTEDQTREGKLSQIHDAFEAINQEISGSYPDQKTRDLVKEKLLQRLDFLDDVKCDQENNPASVIDDEVIIARCIWDRNKKVTGSFSYIDLAFGNPERTYKYLLTFQ
jgi:hypothetical protein